MTPDTDASPDPAAPNPALPDPAAAALADALRAEAPYIVLDAPAPALDVALAALDEAEVATIRLRNPLSAPLSLERAVIQLAPPGIEDEAEASPPEDNAGRVIRALAIRAAGSTALLVVVEQAETLTHRALALLQLLPGLRAPGTPPVRVAFVGTPAFRILLADPRFAPIRDNQPPGPAAAPPEAPKPEPAGPADAGPGVGPSPAALPLAPPADAALAPAAPLLVPFAPLSFAPGPFRPHGPSPEPPARSSAQLPAEPLAAPPEPADPGTPLTAPSSPAEDASVPRRGRLLAAVAGTAALAAIAFVLLSRPRAASPPPPRPAATQPASPQPGAPQLAVAPQPTPPHPTPPQLAPPSAPQPTPLPDRGAATQPPPEAPTPAARAEAPPPGATDAPGGAPPSPAVQAPGFAAASPPAVSSATPPATAEDQQAARTRLFTQFNAFVDRSGMAGRLSPGDRAALFREYLARRYAAAHPPAPAPAMASGSQAAPPPATPPPETGLEVVLLFPAAVPGAEAEALANVARLGPAFPNMTVRATAEPLPDATIRYFRAEDRDLALTLALSLPPAEPDWQVVDMSAAPDKPLRPAVEVWLSPPRPGVSKP